MIVQIGNGVNPKNFLTELKRRNVYRAAVAYGVVAWFLTQLTTQVFPFFEIPNSAVRFFVIVLAIGFPIAMLLSWVYEFSPEGVVRTKTLDPVHAKTAQRATGRILDFIIIGVLLLVIAMLVIGRLPFNVQTGDSIAQKSIAVLPFDNRSEDKANAYFADGIQDEILTRLVSVADLKVISRTSTQQYRSKFRNLREIGKQLGVTNILEGSVQKLADQVRVNVQLINAETDSHLWAATYDQKLTDIFTVESEIAKRIADSLQAKLSGREEQALAVKLTNNPEAYDAYMRGVAFEARSHYPFFDRGLLSKAIGFYELAVKLDANFASAWARLCLSHAFLSFSRDESNHAIEGEAANEALKHAQELEPNSPQTLLALGYYQYWTLGNYSAAKMTFERVIKVLPASSEVLHALGRIAQREGYWDQSVAYHEKALAFDPRNVELLMSASWTYCMLRQFPSALKLYDRALDITPNDSAVMAFKAGIYQAQGDLQEAAKLLPQVNELTANETLGIKVAQLRFERNYAEAIRLLQARLAQFNFGSQSEKAFLQVELALTQRVAGDTADAKVTAEQAHNAIEQFYREQPDNVFLAVLISQALALKGEKELGLKEAQRAVMLSLKANDAVTGPGPEERLALLQMIVGENSRAVSTLNHLLKTPYSGWVYQTPITPGLLRLDPLWDPLRGEPAFQKLCEERQP